MAITVEAIYKNGVLKPAAPLPFRDKQKVRLTVEAPVRRLADAYEIMGFRGTAREADYFAEDPELDHPAPREGS